MPHFFPQLQLLSILVVCSTCQAATLTTLYNFTGTPDGASPYAGVTAGPNGELYGTTNAGGAGHCPDGCGTAFVLTPPGSPSGAWTELVFSFPGNTTAGRRADRWLERMAIRHHDVRGWHRLGNSIRNTTARQRWRRVEQ